MLLVEEDRGAVAVVSPLAPLVDEYKLLLLSQKPLEVLEPPTGAVSDVSITVLLVSVWVDEYP